MPQDRKRRKIGLLGTFDQYTHQQEEAKQEQSEAEARQSQQKSPLGDNNGHAEQPPNIIGNEEDAVSAFGARVASNVVEGFDSGGQMNLNAQPFQADSSAYKDITSQMTRSKRKSFA